MGMLTAEVKRSQETYFETFPSPEYNVKVKEIVEGVDKESGSSLTKRVLVAQKNFKAGEQIYSETPLVSALEPALEVDSSSFGLYISSEEGWVFIQNTNYFIICRTISALTP